MASASRALVFFLCLPPKIPRFLWHPPNFYATPFYATRQFVKVYATLFYATLDISVFRRNIRNPRSYIDILTTLFHSPPLFLWHPILCHPHDNRNLYGPSKILCHPFNATLWYRVPSACLTTGVLRNGKGDNFQTCSPNIIQMEIIKTSTFCGFFHRSLS